MINLNESPIKVTNQHHVTLRADITAEATARATFTDDAVREYFDLDADEDVTRAHVDAYATECEDLDLDWDIGEIDDVDHIKIDARRSERTTIVPPEFVPLPGMEA